MGSNIATSHRTSSRPTIHRLADLVDAPRQLHARDHLNSLTTKIIRSTLLFPNMRKLGIDLDSNCGMIDIDRKTNSFMDTCTVKTIRK